MDFRLAWLGLAWLVSCLEGEGKSSSSLEGEGKSSSSLKVWEVWKFGLPFGLAWLGFGWNVLIYTYWSLFHACC